MGIPKSFLWLGNLGKRGKWVSVCISIYIHTILFKRDIERHPFSSFHPHPKDPCSKIHFWVFPNFPTGRFSPLGNFLNGRPMGPTKVAALLISHHSISSGDSDRNWPALQPGRSAPIGRELAVARKVAPGPPGPERCSAGGGFRVGLRAG